MNLTLIDLDMNEFALMLNGRSIKMNDFKSKIKYLWTTYTSEV